MNQHADETIHLKWDHYGSLHRFNLRRSEWQFSKLLEKIRNIHPLFNDTLGYIDEDGDCVLFSSSLEMDEMLELSKARNDKVIRIKTIGNGKDDDEEKPKESPKQDNSKEIHPNIMCDLCDKFISGIRYKCTVCDDYDLCEHCEKTGIHVEHAMLRLANPRTPKGPFDMKRRWMRGNRHPPCGRPIGFHPPRGPFTPFAINEAIQNVLQRSATCPQPNAEAPPRSKPEDNKKPTRETPKEEQKGGEAFLKDVGTMLQQVLSNFGIDVDMSIEHNNKREKLPKEQPTSLAKTPEMASTNPSVCEPAPPTPFEFKLTPDRPLQVDPTQKAAQEVADKTAKEVIEAVTSDVLKKTEEAVDFAYNTVNNIAENPQTKEELDKLMQNAANATQFAINQAAEMVKRNSSYMAANAENPQFRSFMTNLSQWADQLAAFYPGINPQEAKEELKPQQLYVDKPEAEAAPEVDLLTMSTATALEIEDEPIPAINKEMFYKDVKATDNASIGTNTESDKKSIETQYSDDDSDVEIISSSPTATPPPPLHAASAQATNNIQPTEPAFTEDDGWTLMNNANYEAMCKFYEAKRLAEEAKRKSLEEQIEQRKEQTRLLMEMAALQVENETKNIVQQQPTPSAPTASVFYPPSPNMETLLKKPVEQPKSPWPVLENGGLYPVLQKESECSAGIPYPTLPSTIRPHSKICFFKHPDPIVQNAVDQLEAMGYDNCNGWLTRLAEKCKGDISLILDEAVKDPLHLARLD